ncbi:MAG: DUF924 family protein [Rhizobiaceae bacterium]
MTLKLPDEIIEFWFAEDVAVSWFRRSDALDRAIAEQFLDVFEAADSGELDHWKDSAPGALALTIALDQFPRNLFRGSPRAFDSDSRALDTAKFALDKGYDKLVANKQRQFFYLPFMHSENMSDQRICLALYEELGNSDSLKAAKEHHNIIERFGRYPHRNEILGRKSTDEEVEFLKDHKGF